MAKRPDVRLVAERLDDDLACAEKHANSNILVARPSHAAAASRHVAANAVRACPTAATFVAKMQCLSIRSLTLARRVWNGEVMKLSITADVSLHEPTLKQGYVTWFKVVVSDGVLTYGDARVALVHVGEIADAHGDILPALQGTKLEPLHDVYFERGWYKDDYADGAGLDLLFVDSIEIAADQREKNLELAVIRRLCDSIGSGCQLAVMRYSSALEAAHYGQLGFSISTAGRPSGLMHMKLSQRHARVVDAGSGVFQVLTLDARETAHRRSAAN